MRSARFRRLSQTDHDTLICLVGRHLDANLGKNEYAPATTTPSAVQIRRPPCSGIRVAFANQSPSEEKSLHEVSCRAERSTWSPTHYSSVIPPRNNRATRSCWTR